MKTVRIYFGNGLNELRTSCEESYTDLQKAIEDFISEFEKISKEYQTTGDHRKEYGISDSYNYKQKEICHLELQKYDEEDIRREWVESDLEEVKIDTIAVLNKIVGGLNGWLQTDDFIYKY